MTVRALVVAVVLCGVVACSNATPGPQGPVGPQGPPGVAGEPGPKGGSGDKGDKGDPGSKGDNGPTGAIGPQGPQGDVGPQGPQGTAGVSVVGTSLAIGDTDCPAGGTKLVAVNGTFFACNGEQGARGATGDAGLQGLQGPAGVQGPQGDVGPQGPSGAKGDTGPQGPAGLSVTGASLAVGDGNCPFGGAKFTSVAGDSYVCNGAPGASGDAGPAGPQGPAGSEGPQGAPGASVTSVTLAVGDAVCPAGGAKFILASGDSYACNGASGAQGPAGAKGDRGDTGPVGPTGPQGPKGDTGDIGPRGPAGPTTVLVDANNNSLGPVTVVGLNPVRMVLYSPRAGCFIPLVVDTEIHAVGDGVFYDQPNCTGTPYITSPPLPSAFPGLFCTSVGGSLFAATSGVAVTVNPVLSSRGDGACGNGLGFGTGLPAREVSDPLFPYASPLRVDFR